MNRFNLLISKYVLRSIAPYFVSSWLLLSVVLFVQQAGRFSDIFFSVNIPTNLIWQLSIALIPNVISFTCPMAILVGTMIGLSKMQGDSELVAIRAAGIGNLQIAVPIVLLGIALSLFAFLVNLEGVPLAASLVRRVALQTAIQKLESPIEPGVFNTEIARYTIYVRHGDPETGRWRDVFIYDEDQKNGVARLLTAPEGRIDVTDDDSELILSGASLTTLPLTPAEGAKYVSEYVGELRLAVQTKRGEMIDRLRSMQADPEELGLGDLANYAATREGDAQTEARLIWQRRITMSITPLIFCLLGTTMILRFNRGGRGIGSLLALGILIAYYLVAFLGEQLARSGEISVIAAGIMPIAASAMVIIWFSLSTRIHIFENAALHVRELFAKLARAPERLQTRNILVDLTTGLRDLDLFLNLAKFFILSLAFLSTIFIIFTAFELWKFAGAMDGGIGLLGRYLVFLIPYVYIQLAPSAAMIAILATYVIKSRQNEIVTWISAGQSIYRLLLPCLVLTLALGAVDWLIQESIFPHSNRLQDELRTRIRSRGKTAVKAGKYWTADDGRIFSISEVGLASDNESATEVATFPDRSASDNESQVRPVEIYEFDQSGSKLQTVYRGNAASKGDTVAFWGPVEKISLDEGHVIVESVNGMEIQAEYDPFVGVDRKPSHMSFGDLARIATRSYSETERRIFSVEVEKRRKTPIVPFVIALFTAPFALSLSRKGKAVTVGYAVGLWLLFTGTTSVFEQFGLNGFVAPAIAVWAPLVLFAAFGVYMLSKVRT